MTTTPDLFVYRSLDSSKREIRVFYMNPVSSSETITGTLVHVSLDSEIDCDTDTCYDTISYCWGDSTLSNKVLIDGKVLRVTNSAEQALRTMCFTGEIHRVWIDSICINQESFEERSQQVRLMGDIYREGCVNLIDLGNEDEEIMSRATRNIKDIYEEIRTETNDFAEFESHVSAQTDRGLAYWTTSSTHLKTRLNVEALVKFFSKPWFYRLWVVQEAVLATSSDCHCGDYEVDFSQVMTVATWLVHKSYCMPKEINFTQGIRNAMNLWYLAEYKNQKYPGGELEKILDYTFDRHATDLRDKLYGILGLLRYTKKEETIPSLLMPDYTQSANRVIQDMTRFLVRDSRNLNFFRKIDHSDGGPSLEICSWQMPVEPFERNSKKANPFPLVYPGLELTATLSEEDTLLYTKDPDTLCAKGSPIDRVGDVSTVMSFGLNEECWELNLVLDELSTFISKHLTNAEKVDTTYSRRCLAQTMTVGLRSMHTLATEEDITSFERIISPFFDEDGRPVNPLSASISPVQQIDENNFRTTMQLWTLNRRYFWSENGLFGLGPRAMRSGDSIVDLFGCKWPVILRRRQEDNEWQVLGVVYIGSIIMESNFGGTQTVSSDLRQNIPFIIR